MHNTRDSTRRLRTFSEVLFRAFGIPLLGLGLIVSVLFLTGNLRSDTELEVEMANESIEGAVVQLESTEDFSYSRLAVEANTAPGVVEGVDMTVYAAHGNPPTIGNYCVLVVAGDVARHYDSSTGEYTDGTADDEFTCEADSGEWN